MCPLIKKGGAAHARPAAGGARHGTPLPVARNKP